MIDLIIDYIKINRVSTTEVADALGKKGALVDTYSLNRGHFKVGRCQYTYIYKESNWTLHEQIQQVEKNSIVLVDDLGSNGRAIFGDIVAKYVLLYSQAAAIVTNGKIRDAHSLIKEKYPIWSSGVNPVGCFNIKPIGEIDQELLKERKDYFNNSIIVADDTGVVIIQKDNINEKLLNKLKNIEVQEDTWFDCIDRLKWNTFDTICLQKYTNNDKKNI